MIYPFYIIFGILPSIIWLLFYLRKDVHPEPNSMVIKVFLWGMLATLPAGLIELGFSKFISKFISSWLGDSPFSLLLYFFFAIALTEEVMKYLVVRDKVLKSSELDEPTDIILYLIIAALGFAALENIFYLIQLQFFKAALLTASRFLGAIFLHALCSGALGYFLALSFYQPKRRPSLFSFGLILAIFLHGLFNFSIIKIDQTLIKKDGSIFILNSRTLAIYSILVVAILVGLAIFVSSGFKRLRKMKSVCKIK